VDAKLPDARWNTGCPSCAKTRLGDQGGRPLAGAIFFGVCALALLLGAYAMWPADFFSTALAEHPLAMLLRAAASIVLLGIAIEFLAALAIVTQSDR